MLFDEEITKKDGENVFFKGLTKIFVNNKKLLMADLSNGPHEKVMICYIIMLCFLDLQFVKKISFNMVIGLQIKEEEYYQN